MHPPPTHLAPSPAPAPPARPGNVAREALRRYRATFAALDSGARFFHYDTLHSMYEVGDWPAFGAWVAQAAAPPDGA